MKWDEYQVRQWLRREHQLLRELSLMLVVALVVGVYFLEHVHTTLEHSRRQSAQALAQHIAGSSAEYVVTGNLVSLNVIATHAAALETVERVEFRSVAGIVLASAGSARSETVIPVSRAVRLEDQSVAGTVELWPSNTSAAQEENLESWFVLVALCLLALRVAGEAIWRRLKMERASPEDVEADMVPILTMSQTHGSHVNSAARTNIGAGTGIDGSGEADEEHDTAKAVLRISIVNFDRMQDRLTAQLLDEMVSAYREPLDGIALVYGAKIVTPLGKECLLAFYGDRKEASAFQAVCAGMLFRAVTRRVSEQRKKQGRSALEFKVLISSDSDARTSWAFCLAGVPGRVHIPEAELIGMELDTRLLYQAERCIEVSNGESSVRLQPVEQLAQRYQKLIAGQVESLLADGVRA
ncbi:MAG: hypothetical protein KBT87_10165 [Gammaproteobacteria bacterium]|nr:hypothetical protein [Gammaproteobacteria bacterium]MBQ0775027.1 hypothetical protein [Gammaproteobacteria bacterium]